MTTHEQPHRPVDTLYGDELDRLYRMSKIAPEVAVIFTEKFCEKYSVERPGWFARTAAELTRESVTPGSRRPVGRARASLPRYRQDMIHFCRWDTVLEMRRGQKEVKEQVESLRSRSGGEHLLPDREKMLNWLGHTWYHAYACAAMYLNGTPAHGSPETMKASYNIVQKCNKNRKEVMRFCIEEHDIMAALGDETIDKLFRCRKWVPLYDLTP